MKLKYLLETKDREKPIKFRMEKEEYINVTYETKFNNFEKWSYLLSIPAWTIDPYQYSNSKNIMKEIKNMLSLTYKKYTMWEDNKGFIKGVER